jgi:hypothetical protein
VSFIASNRTRLLKWTDGDQKLVLKYTEDSQKGDLKCPITHARQRLHLTHEWVGQLNGSLFPENPEAFVVVSGCNVVTYGMRKDAGVAWPALAWLSSARNFRMRRQTNLCNNGRIKHRGGILKLGRAGDRTGATLQTPVGRYLTQLTDLEYIPHCYLRKGWPISQVGTRGCLIWETRRIEF